MVIGTAGNASPTTASKPGGGAIVGDGTKATLANKWPPIGVGEGVGDGERVALRVLEDVAVADSEELWKGEGD